MSELSVKDDFEIRLQTIVQRNADLSDSQHAQASSLCLYLLDMREFYRWENHLPLDHAPARADLGPWISAREAFWETLRAGPSGGDQSFEPLLPELSVDPFDTQAARSQLAAAGLVHGAGVGRFGRPQFFLGRLEASERREGCDILVCGEELARGIGAPPAMSRDREILIRQDALERWLWSRYEEWRLHPRENGLSVAFGIHAAALGGDPSGPAVIRRMALVEREALILHELGERRVDAELAGGRGATTGDAWHDLIEDLPNRKLEVMVRSVRDLLADCTVTLPVLLERGEAPSIHCWFGVLDGPRQKLAGGLVDAYRRWHRGDAGVLADRVGEAREHWRNAAGSLVSAWQSGGVPAVSSLLEGDRLVFA